MSTQLEQPEVVARLVGATSVAEAARAAADRLADYRDDIVRQARSVGVPAARIAALTGLSRPRVYQILNAPHPDDDTANAEFAMEMDALWVRAVDEWDAEGCQGSPEEYFDLGEAFDAAS
jgi:hypothetical protein